MMIKNIKLIGNMLPVLYIRTDLGSYNKNQSIQDVEIIKTGAANFIIISWRGNVLGKMIIDAARKFKEEEFNRT